MSDNVLTYYTTKDKAGFQDIGVCYIIGHDSYSMNHTVWTIGNLFGNLEKRAKGDKRGSIPVTGAFLSIEEDTNFSLTVEDHTYHFQVGSYLNTRAEIESSPANNRFLI